MKGTSSRGKGRGETGSGSDLLTPLQAAAPPEAMETAEIRPLVEAIRELKALVASPSRSFACDIEALRQVAQNVSASIEALRTDLGRRKERQARTVGDIQETLAVIGRNIEGFAAKLEADEVIRDGLRAHAGELQTMREGVDRLTRAVEASRTETAGLRQAFERADSPGSDLRALDAWRDDFIRHVDALLATVRTEGGAPLAREDAGRETALVDAEGLTARMGEAFDAVEATLKRHGESLRRNENSSLLTRRGVESLTAAFGRNGREYRRWRLSWASPLILLVAFAAGMLLESNVHWFYAWLSGR